MLVRLGVLSAGYLLSKVRVRAALQIRFNRYLGFRAFDSGAQVPGPLSVIPCELKAQCYLPFWADPGLPCRGPRRQALSEGQTVTASRRCFRLALLVGESPVPACGASVSWP